MHLRSIKLRGFKSFPDPVEVSLEPGVAVVVGPNGSGKSNVSDAIVWAAGSLTPSELRADKPDVIASSACRREFPPPRPRLRRDSTVADPGAADGQVFPLFALGGCPTSVVCRRRAVGREKRRIGQAGVFSALVPVVLPPSHRRNTEETL